MAEPYPLNTQPSPRGKDISLMLAPSASGWAQASPLWRSILAPPVGQRVLILEHVSRGIFEALIELEPRVRIEGAGQGGRDGAGTYDLVLEELQARGLRPRSAPARAPLVAPGGRWIAVLQGAPAVGLHAWSVLRQARKEGFEKIETFYAHPSLASPSFLVPLDRIEPIQYFLDLAMGVPTFRKRCRARIYSMLAKLGIHREVLPNLILTARRKA